MAQRATKFNKLLVKASRADSNTTADTPLTIAAVTGQTGPLMQLMNAAGVVTAAWGPTGLPLDSSAAGLGGKLNAARAKYVFSADGGAIATITPVSNAIIPDNAIVVGGIINSIVAPLSGGLATISIGTSAGSSATSIKGATAVATYSIDALIATVPVFTAGSSFKMTAAGSITLTVAVDTLTAGTIEITVFYILASA